MDGLDLFSGIGGIALALRPWVRPVAYCEIDEYARAVLLSRMAEGSLPRAPIWSDVRTLAKHHIGACVDIISGGFPCQNISRAGRGEGLAGKQSSLAFEVLRLAREIKPSFVFLENVPAIRTSGAERMVKEMAALGYDCRWGCLSAYDVGAPHLRDRWFLLAARIAADADSITLWDRGEWSPQGNAETSDKSSDDGFTSWRQAQPSLCGMDDGPAFRLDRLRGLGNAVAPAQAREAFKRLMGL